MHSITKKVLAAVLSVAMVLSLVAVAPVANNANAAGTGKAVVTFDAASAAATATVDGVALTPVAGGQTYYDLDAGYTLDPDEYIYGATNFKVSLEFTAATAAEAAAITTAEVRVANNSTATEKYAATFKVKDKTVIFTWTFKTVDVQVNTATYAKISVVEGPSAKQAWAAAKNVYVDENNSYNVSDITWYGKDTTFTYPVTGVCQGTSADTFLGVTSISGTSFGTVASDDYTLGTFEVSPKTGFALPVSNVAANTYTGTAYVLYSDGTYGSAYFYNLAYTAGDDTLRFALAASVKPYTSGYHVIKAEIPTAKQVKASGAGIVNDLFDYLPTQLKLTGATGRGLATTDEFVVEIPRTAWTSVTGTSTAVATGTTYNFQISYTNLQSLLANYGLADTYDVIKDVVSTNYTVGVRVVADADYCGVAATPAITTQSGSGFIATGTAGANVSGKLNGGAATTQVSAVMVTAGSTLTWGVDTMQTYQNITNFAQSNTYSELYLGAGVGATYLPISNGTFDVTDVTAPLLGGTLDASMNVTGTLECQYIAYNTLTVGGGDIEWSPELLYGTNNMIMVCTANTEYTATLYIPADGAHYFANNINVKINGETVVGTPYTYLRTGDYLKVEYKFPATRKYDPVVDFGKTLYVATARPEENDTMGNLVLSDSSSSYATCLSTVWTDSTGATVTGKFVKGETYTAVATFKYVDGYAINTASVATTYALLDGTAGAVSSVVASKVNQTFTVKVVFNPAIADLHYNVSFNANGGKYTGAEVVRVEKGEALEFAWNGNLFSRTGYYVKGWYTKATGGIRIYNDGNYKPESDVTLYAHWGKVATKAFGLKVSTTSKKIKATWTKQTSVTGYQVKYKKGSNGSWKSLTITSNTANKTISKLTSGKTYYVKVRAYKTVAGKKFYSTYSSTKKIKVK